MDGKLSPARRVVLAAIAALTILAAGAAVAVSLAGPGSPALKLGSSAHGALSNSLDGGAILSASNLAPGDSTRGTVTLGNTGTVPGSLSVSMARLSDSHGPDGRDLSKLLDLEVTDVTAGSDAPIYAGKLSAMPASSLVTLVPGDRRTYRFVASLPEAMIPHSGANTANLYQRASVFVDYRWTLSQVASRPCGDLLRGGSGANRLIGTRGGDRILGGRGADLIRGRRGTDCAMGGRGPDAIHGGRGNDRLRGGRGADRIGGGAGRDAILGGVGNDVIHVRGGGPDVVRCGAGHRDVAFVDRDDRVRGCEIRRTARP